MTDTQRNEILAHIDEVLSREDNTYVSIGELLAAAQALVWRVCGSGSPYTKRLDGFFGSGGSHSTCSDLAIGLLKALRADVEAGRLDSLVETIHTDLFSDMLETAEHLLGEGYLGAKDAAAVMAGGTLESHLRQLCIKHNIDTEITTSQGDRRPKRASAMNSDLNGTAYNNVERASVESWLAIRNHAAHAEYDRYDAAQVRLMISGVREFILRHPA